MKQPAAHIQVEVYEDSIRRCGLASATLPQINYTTTSITGAGMMGPIDVPLVGMVENMTLTLNWLEITGDAVGLQTPEKHNIELRVATENWQVEQAEIEIQSDKYVMIVQPRSLNPGDITPMSAPNASQEFTVYYFAGYKNGTQLFEIDKRNMKNVINGTDYFADVKKALGL